MITLKKPVRMKDGTEVVLLEQFNGRFFGRYRMAETSEWIAADWSAPSGRYTNVAGPYDLVTVGEDDE